MSTKTLRSNSNEFGFCWKKIFNHFKITIPTYLSHLAVIGYSQLISEIPPDVIDANFERVYVVHSESDNFIHIDRISRDASGITLGQFLKICYNNRGRKLIGAKVYKQLSVQDLAGFLSRIRAHCNDNVNDYEAWGYGDLSQEEFDENQSNRFQRICHILCQSQTCHNTWRTLINNSFFSIDIECFNCGGYIANHYRHKCVKDFINSNGTEEFTDGRCLQVYKIYQRVVDSTKPKGQRENWILHYTNPSLVKEPNSIMVKPVSLLNDAIEKLRLGLSAFDDLKYRSRVFILSMVNLRRQNKLTLHEKQVIDLVSHIKSWIAIS